MRSCSMFWLASAVACSFIAGTAAAQERKSLPAPGWIKDYEEGRAEARQTAKPIFAVIR